MPENGRPPDPAQARNDGFTVCVVLYGDHYELACRCLSSIVHAIDPRYVASLRIALNAVCSQTRELVSAVRARLEPLYKVRTYDGGDRNRLKYPMLRKMLYDPGHPVQTPYVMYFDDDSFLRHAVAVEGEEDESWFGQAARGMTELDLMGSPYTIRIQGNQAAGIMAQPWFNRKPVLANHRFTFMTGGWWAARFSMLRDWDYPFKDITHNGGDVMLGELCRQRNYRMGSYSRFMPADSVKINADPGGISGKALRRGESRPPVWSRFDPAVPVDHSHHEFPVSYVC